MHKHRSLNRIISYLTPSAKASKECSIGVENLYAIVARIGYVNVIFVVHGNAPIKYQSQYGFSIEKDFRTWGI